MKEFGSFKEELESRLIGGKFRLLNEKVYTNKEFTDEEAKNYHYYYSKQVKKWPVNPNDLIFKEIGKIEGNKNLVNSDLGCGDKLPRNSNHLLFDKYPMNEKVVKAELESIPVEKESSDIVVCCLSLMTDYLSKILLEINRILKMGGIFYLAEVKSRIERVRSFVIQIEKMGFKTENVDTSNKCFIVIKVSKNKDVSTLYVKNSGKRLPVIKLAPCLYKKR